MNAVSVPIWDTCGRCSRSVSAVDDEDTHRDLEERFVEQIVLGCALLHPEAWEDLQHIPPRLFSWWPHREVAEALHCVYRRGTEAPAADVLLELQAAGDAAVVAYLPTLIAPAMTYTTRPMLAAADVAENSARLAVAAALREADFALQSGEPLEVVEAALRGRGLAW